MNPTSTSEPRVAAPTAFPDSGTYGVTQRVTLLCATDGATIHYITDGSTPTSSGPVFDPYHLPTLEAVNDGVHGVKSDYTIRALAVKAGMMDSPVATFTYTIDRRDLDAYLYDEVQPGLWMIRDFDDDKMYMVLGSERALLIDAGMGRGDLRTIVEKLVGDLPLEVVITHAHPDHIATMGQFQGRYKVYMNHTDMSMIHRFIETMHFEIDPDQIIDLREGAVFDLGNRRFEVYEVPGHSQGSIVLYDSQSGLLIAGDAVGSNRPTITDSLWMQFPGMSPIDTYLSALQIFRETVRGSVTEIYGGHNDIPIRDEKYLDNLEEAAQTLVDNGTDVLVPSLRPTDSDIWQVVVGDRLTDPNWAAINVMRETCLSVPADQIATLSNLRVNGATLTPRFHPATADYTAHANAARKEIQIIPTATSRRYTSLTINKASVKSNAPFTAPMVQGENIFQITVTSPDGSANKTYTLTISGALG